MQISLREFQRNAVKYLDQLPLTLTQYSKPIACVIPYNEKSVAAPTAKAVSEIPISWGTRIWYCKFCGQKKSVQNMPYQFDDGSGDGEAYFCQACYQAYEARHNPKKIEIPDRPINYANLQEFSGSLPKPVKKKK